MKKEIIIAISLLIVGTVAGTILSFSLVQVLYGEEQLETNPYQHIIEKNEEYKTNISIVINETQNAIETYRETENVSYLSYSVQLFNLLTTLQLEYHSWYTYNVSKEINDFELDSQIFRDVYNFEYNINDIRIQLHILLE